MIDSLIEEALFIGRCGQKETGYSKLKDSAMELAESLNQTSEELNELAKELEKQAEHTPESAQAEADELEKLLKKRKSLRIHCRKIEIIKKRRPSRLSRNH